MKIALLGDIAFFGRYTIGGNRDIWSYFKPMAELLKRYDYVIGNLETPFVSNQKPYGFKSAYVKSDVNNIELLKYLNINIVNLANNHIYDFGEDSFNLTKYLLSSHNVQFFGIDDKQCYIEDKGVKIACHGYCCYSTNPLGLNKGVNKLDISLVQKNMSLNAKNGFLNLVSIHHGQEHVHTPNYNHLSMARQWSDSEDYIFYGHHPHVLQGIESINKSLIAYSLGNFCFDDVYTSKSEKPLISQTKVNKSSIILELEIEGNQLKSHTAIPFFLGEDLIELDHDEIITDLNEYSLKLQEDKEKYIQDRSKQLNQYIESRKTLRDYKWYLKRLNINSLGMILSAIYNKKRYNKYVIDQIKVKDESFI